MPIAHPLGDPIRVSYAQVPSSGRQRSQRTVYFLLSAAVAAAYCYETDLHYRYSPSWGAAAAPVPVPGGSGSLEERPDEPLVNCLDGAGGMLEHPDRIAVLFRTLRNAVEGLLAPFVVASFEVEPSRRIALVQVTNRLCERYPVLEDALLEWAARKAGFTSVCLVPCDYPADPRSVFEAAREPDLFEGYVLLRNARQGA
jgi:hypothetical protein